MVVYCVFLEFCSFLGISNSTFTFLIFLEGLGQVPLNTAVPSGISVSVATGIAAGPTPRVAAQIAGVTRGNLGVTPPNVQVSHGNDGVSSSWLSRSVGQSAFTPVFPTIMTTQPVADGIHCFSFPFTNS